MVSVTIALSSALVAAAGVAPAAAVNAGSAATPIGNAPLLPALALGQGRTATATPLQLSIVLQPTDGKDLARLAESVATPGSPDYRHYLAVGQFTPRFGPAFTRPVNGQQLVDTTQPFSWSTFAGIQAYDLVIGTTPNGANLVSTGILPATRTSFTAAAKLPSGSVLYASLLTEIGGVWTFQAIAFTAK